MNRGLSRAAFALLIVATLPSAALAHDMWLSFAGDAQQRRVVVNYGHPDDRPPTMPDKILDLDAVTSGGRTSLLSGIAATQEGGFGVAASRPFADDGRSLFAARYDNGLWVRQQDGTIRNATRRLVPDAVETLWSAKFAKAVSGAGSPWQTVLGHELELVPLSDPAAAKAGDTLRLRVYFRGQPLPGAAVERGDGVTAIPEKDIPRFIADADGVASVPIVRTGAHLLVADHKVTPSASPDQANTDLYNATFWFSNAGSR